MPLSSVKVVHNNYSLERIEDATEMAEGQVIGYFRGLILSSHFQPIFSLAHKRPVGYEALLRARDQQGVSVSPLTVFDMVESEAENVFLDRLCRNLHIRNFSSMADKTSWLFLNVNPLVTIRGVNYGPYFAELLARYNFPAYRIVIEILEQSIQEETLLAGAVDYYKKLGCLVAIDDFGAGHSNFDRIWHLSPQIVKLDRSMITQAATNIAVRRVLPILVGLIHESGSLSLIEGVETEEEALIAMDTGIDFVQGYYFGRPQKFIPDSNASSVILPQLCDKYKLFRQQESKKYQSRMQEFIPAFVQSAKHVEAGMEAATACVNLLLHPNITRCFLLNEVGKQLGTTQKSTLYNPLFDQRFNPLLEANDANWSRRQYFQRAIKNHGEVQISRPYLSITDANMCVTLSISIKRGQEMLVLCCDLDWRHNVPEI